MSDYKDALDRLALSAEEKERLLAAAVVGAQEQEAAKAAAAPTAFPRKRPRLRLAVAVVAAVAAIAMCGVAYATGGFMSVGQAFDDLFNGAPARTEIADKIGRPIEASTTDAGITITADAIIGDADNYLVVFSLMRDDGQPFEHLNDTIGDGLLPFMFRSNITSVDVGSGATGSSWFYDADPTDPSIQYVEERAVYAESGSIVGQTMRCDWHDLIYQPEGREPEVMVEGHWKMKFEVGYEDSSIELPVGATFDLNGMPATIERLAVSPIALSLRYSLDGEMPAVEIPSGRMSSEEDARISDYLGIGTITMTFANGSTLEQSGDLGGSVETEGGKTICETHVLFDRVIDADEVVSVTVGDTEITV